MNKWSDQCKLIRYIGGGQDSDGFPVDLEREEKTVFCDMQSVKEEMSKLKRMLQLF